VVHPFVVSGEGSGPGGQLELSQKCIGVGGRRIADEPTAHVGSGATLASGTIGEQRHAIRLAPREHRHRVESPPHDTKHRHGVIRPGAARDGNLTALDRRQLMRPGEVAQAQW
jgi:hypothetical protein